MLYAYGSRLCVVRGRMGLGPCPLPTSRETMERNDAGKCGNGKMMCNSVGVVHAILDFFILMIPMPLIWNLKISTGNKIFLSILLLCGVL